MKKNKNHLAYIMALTGLLFASGCKTLLPSEVESSSGPWKSYEQTEKVFKKIVPNKTTVSDLRELGIDFKKTPNLKTLTYLDVMERFKLDSTIFNNIKLPPGMAEALNQHEKCKAYELTLEQTNKKRVGSFWKDMLSFEQITHSTGWSFEAIIVMVDDTVVYVLYSGSPHINKRKSNKQP
ncbi:hypothetical protein CMO96_01870, partial [Candidatus Woesebacteria bacterium]|nr:hypothetical protein [Candidatus Woesebacteria bacterium]